MIKYKTKMEKVPVFDKFICDKCKQEVVNEMELQETYTIAFTGGYSSIFGDMETVECDLCQECLQELIGDFCRYTSE